MAWIELKFEVGYDAQSRERGIATAGKIDREQVLRDVAAAIEVARCLVPAFAGAD
jgi:hypothetical protein